MLFGVIVVRSCCPHDRLPSRWREHGLSKRGHSLTRLQGFKFCKKTFFIITALITSHFNNQNPFWIWNMWAEDKMCPYRGAGKSLVRPDWKKNWKVAIFRPTRRSLLPRRPGWTDNLLNFFEWLAKVRVWSLLLFSFLVGLRTYQHPCKFIECSLCNERALRDRNTTAT
jgi:hypothetical protein